MEEFKTGTIFEFGDLASYRVPGIPLGRSIHSKCIFIDGNIETQYEKYKKIILVRSELKNQIKFINGFRLINGDVESYLPTN